MVLESFWYGISLYIQNLFGERNKHSTCLKKLKNIFHIIRLRYPIVILVIAAFFRIYKISDYMTFLGDEGRDAIVAKDILQGNFTLLGPRASAGDFFLGPIYYYMMAPFLFLSNLDPVGPAIMVALFGVATVFLVYYVGVVFNARRAYCRFSLCYFASCYRIFQIFLESKCDAIFLNTHALSIICGCQKTDLQAIFNSRITSWYCHAASLSHNVSWSNCFSFFMLIGEPLLKRKIC